MEVLHMKGFVHRDIALRNVLIDLRTMESKVSDFRLSRLLVSDDSKSSYKTGGSQKLPIAWCAPETLQENTYSEKSDVWSFGVLVWELLNESVPFSGVSTATLMTQIKTGKLRLPLNSPWDPRMKELCRDCWKFEPSERPDMGTIYKL